MFVDVAIVLAVVAVDIVVDAAFGVLLLLLLLLLFIFLKGEGEGRNPLFFK